jgi:hypothetical protein
VGSLEGTVDLASNSRVSRAVLNVGGATLPDILITAPSFHALFLQLLASLGIEPNTPEFLLFTIGVHWIVDPADPANFAGHLVTSPLPNLLADATGGVPQSPKAILGQAARCDATVPNPTNELLYGIVGLGPLEPTEASATPGLQWFMNSTSGTCPVSGAAGPGISHGFLLDWNNAGAAASAQSNVVRYFLRAPIDPTPVIVPAAP